MDHLLYEMKESFSDNQISRRGVEIMGLIRGLSESYDLGIRNVVVYCDDHWIYQSIIGRGKTKKKIDHLVEEAQSILEKMACIDTILVARNDVKFAFRLAREAIASQSSSVDVKAEQGRVCGICLEETDEERMFFTDKCLHRHCYSCVKQHVEVKLLSGIEPTCLEYGCKFVLTLESCSKVLTAKLIDMWKHKMKEDSVPAAEKIYCPYPSCSMLMSKTELSSHEDEQSNVRSCIKCCGLFCIDCKVPSHTDLSCEDYKKLHPDPLVDDLKLQSLANNNMWRQCVKCRHLIELSSGCNHMTCRCGYEFCYQCGIEWKEDQKLARPVAKVLVMMKMTTMMIMTQNILVKRICVNATSTTRVTAGMTSKIFYDNAQEQTLIIDPDVVQEYEDFTTEEVNDDDGNDYVWDDYDGFNNSGGEGGFFDEDFYRDYYTL
ncbi:LOW QUALITY PROTEIN: ATP-dependent RNA helicase DEAH12, chloroplastic [Capsella rubella]|uniref:LOW QUALITY PROTEIN: ATP-dependent RNA helicase DEAH12, chloroplastic n=1 Tax=Capsella rubella TaxID=81985 RepID=UPI000CD4F46D|nr:LOW QUALITY PROTEIN: ATP-dependent RNA helicase DEAH12, chloroplastic [Capsella rubella]